MPLVPVPKAAVSAPANKVFSLAISRSKRATQPLPESAAITAARVLPVERSVARLVLGAAYPTRPPAHRYRIAVRVGTETALGIPPSSPPQS